MRLQPELDESLGHGDNLGLVLAVGPGHPASISLDSQSRPVRTSADRLLDHRPHRHWSLAGAGMVRLTDPHRFIWSDCCELKLDDKKQHTVL